MSLSNSVAVELLLSPCPTDKFELLFTCPSEQKVQWRAFFQTRWKIRLIVI